ncbi:AIM24 family protein [Microcoleus sp. F4-D5]|uniref:AIM24 family protein n=1 Tax=Microcoleus sp. F4-D5 TaxID=2818760 RepID=UPI002FD22046
MDYSDPVYQGTGTVKLEPRQKGNFLHCTPLDLSDAQQWEFDDGIFQFCSDNVVIGAKKLKLRQVAASNDGRWRIAITALREQKATVVAATSSPAKVVELKQSETLIADCDLVKGFTKGIEEDYRKLGHFGKGGGEGCVWFYQGKGKLLVCENDAMSLG